MTNEQKAWITFRKHHYWRGFAVASILWLMVVIAIISVFINLLNQ